MINNLICKECGKEIGPLPGLARQCCMCQAVMCTQCANNNMATFSITEGPQGNADICESCYKKIIPGSEEWNGNSPNQ